MSKNLHIFSMVTGIFGFLALVGAWIATFNGTFFEQTQEHLFNDAKGLLLTSIAFGIGTLIHQNEEAREK